MREAMQLAQDMPMPSRFTVAIACAILHRLPTCEPLRPYAGVLQQLIHEICRCVDRVAWGGQRGECRALPTPCRQSTRL